MTKSVNYKLLRFTCKIEVGVQTGRELLASLNAKVLDEIVGSQLYSVYAQPGKGSPLKRRVLAMLGWLDGLDQSLALQCIETIRSEKIESVYIEGSNYGRLAKEIKTSFPTCKIITFFHNVESSFFWGSLKREASLHAFFVLIANYLTERAAVKYSDRIICLNKRDSVGLKRIYGRGASDIIPMSILEKEVDEAKPMQKLPKKDFGIFVGGAFYANVSGMQWFAKNVAHRLPCKIVVVGRDFEKHAAFFDIYPNIQIVGSVDDVGEWYRKASFAIAPIFDGSGMKTKVAEALVYGLPVVGTSEAFVGYEDVVSRAGIVCNTGEEFAAGIEKLHSDQIKFDSIELRHLYERYYSFAATKRKFQRILNDL